MLYRKYGATGEMVSELAFGCMRLPIIDGDTSKIDEPKAIEMVRYAIDHGLNYLDTAYPYHDGKSEGFVKKVIQDGYREKVMIATKLPCWLVKSREDMDKYLNEQLENLGIESIDFYLLHALNKERWTEMRDFGAAEFLDQAIADGRIKHAGFSYHDIEENFYEIVDGYHWEFCQLQYNYIDENHQQGRKGLEYAAAKGLGIAIMEPLRGGNLAHSVPSEIQELFDSNEMKRTPAEWALRWVYDHEDVHVVLSGMSTMEQVVENVKIAAEAEKKCMSEHEIQIMNQAKDMYKARIQVDCTGCNYCMPCPYDVNIPKNFSVFNEAHMFDGDGATNRAKYSYTNFIAESSRADICVECGECLSKCPQQINIPEELKRVATFFE